VLYEMVIEVLASADIGLALYGSVGGPNTTEVGLASGKLCHFLQVGVPVIVSDFPVLREFVTRHRVGVPLSDLDHLPQAIATIMADYEGYCRRAAETFTRELAFQNHFQGVLDRLDAEVRQMPRNA
jgi:glycosyltransferase involved in cell wall biosynthesis